MAAAYFVDTSALAKRYVFETGSTWLRDVLDPTTGCEVFIVRTTAVELVAALTRRERGGSISTADANLARSEFRVDLESEYQVVELSAALVNRAMHLAESHQLRGYDAIQLAAALDVNALRLAHGLSTIIFVSADSELNTAAAAEALVVADPNTHS